MTDIPKLSPTQPQATLLDLQERIAQCRAAASGAGEAEGRKDDPSTVVTTGAAGILAGSVTSLAEALDLAADDIGENEAAGLAAALRGLLEGDGNSLTSPAGQSILRTM